MQDCLSCGQEAEGNLPLCRECIKKAAVDIWLDKFTDFAERLAERGLEGLTDAGFTRAEVRRFLALSRIASAAEALLDVAKQKGP